MIHTHTPSFIPTVKLSLVFGLFSLLFAALYFTNANAAESAVSNDGRLITIHDRGTDRVILTKARSIAEALNEAKVHLDEKDTVEPGLEEKLVASDYAVNIYRARPVIVVDGTTRQKIMTPYQTSEMIASAAGIQLHDEDKTSLARSEDIIGEGAGQVMTIDRATEFTLDLYGTSAVTYSQSKTVGEMLASKKVRLGANDTLAVAPSTPLTDGMVVQIWRNGKQLITQEQPVAFETERIQDADRPAGYKEIKTAGELGKKTVSYEIEMRNGKELSRKETQSVVTQQPKKQVEVIGAKPVFSGSFSDALSKLRSCESGGSYTNKKNPSYRGAYQYGYATWGNKYGIYDPADATPAQQDQAAWETYQRRGWQPWPNCGKSLPDTFR